MVVETPRAQEGGALLPSSPAAIGADSGCVLNEGVGLTPASGRLGSRRSGRPPKKTSGRKPAAKEVAVRKSVPSTRLCGELGTELVAAGAGAKAKRSRATPMEPRAPSSRAKAKLGDMSSLDSAKLRLADKNLGTSDVDTAGEAPQC
uniref:Uncharacterized protein n=1 Tax=Triticum aestivum TaxID=4565 RepID=A0A3B6EHM8_WHEAT